MKNINVCNKAIVFKNNCFYLTINLSRSDISATNFNNKFHFSTTRLVKDTTKIINNGDSALTQVAGKYVPIDNLDNFYSWLAGFTDAEGMFYIKLTESEKNAVFSFKISLHVDDVSVLEFIQKTLGFGKVYTSEKASFIVSNQKELKNLIDIFSKYNLNTTKHLNFLGFKKAFELYTSSKTKSLEVMEEIKHIKNNMNKLRVEFVFPQDYKIKLNDYWVLGFVEGEGSFSIVKKNNYKLRFSVGQSSKDLNLMEFLKGYFINLAIAKGFNELDIAIGLYRSKMKNYEDMLSIDIRDSNFIENVIIPFFDNLSHSWRSKKYLDFQDFKFVLNLRNKGAQFTEEGVEVLDLILSQMNNNRLSSSLCSNNSITREQLILKIEDLLNKPSNLEIKEDGRIFIKNLNKFYNPGKGSTKVGLFDENGNLENSFDSITACAKHLGVSNDVVSRTLINKGKPVSLDSKVLFVKRIATNTISK